MELTLSEALTFGGLTDATVAAGKDYLSRKIRSVSILEITDPSVAEWASAQELYISSFYSIQNNLAAQISVVRALSDCGCTGLVIGHLGLWFDEIPPQIIELCDQLHFPLVVANPNLNYLAMINPIFERLMNLKHAAKPDESLQTEIMSIALNENNIYEALKKIAVLTNAAVSFFDSSYRCLYSNKVELDKAKEIQLLHSRGKEVLSGCEQGCLRIESATSPKTIVTAQADNAVQGYAVFNMDKGGLEPSAAVINNLRIAFSFLLSRKQNMMERISQDKSEYWTCLANGDFFSDEAAVQAGLKVGMDIQKTRYVALIQIDEQNLSAAPDGESQVSQTISHWLSHRAKTIAKAHASSIVFPVGNALIFLLEDNHKDPGFDSLFSKILEMFLQQESLSVTVGISNRFTSPLRVPQAYEQAMASARLGGKYYGHGRAIHYEEVWAMSYADQLKNDKEAVALANAMLEPLRNEEQGGSPELLTTFRMLLTHQDNATSVAQALFLHRNTVIYRRNRIIEQLKEDPFVFPRSYMYFVAFQIAGEE